MAEERVPEHLVPAVLQKAAELQRSTDVPGAQDGLMLAEIKQIAEEVGLPAAAIDGIVEGLPIQGQTTSIGAASQRVQEFVVEGELPDDEIAEMVALARRATGLFGEVREDAGMVVWDAKPQMPSLYINFVRGGGETHVQIVTASSMTPRGADALFGSLMAAFLLLLVTASRGVADPAFWGLLGVGIAASGGGWFAVRRSLAAGREKLLTLKDRLQSAGRRLTAGGSTAEGRSE